MFRVADRVRVTEKYFKTGQAGTVVSVKPTNWVCGEDRRRASQSVDVMLDDDTLVNIFDINLELIDTPFNIETATDQELADEARRLWKAYAPVAAALRKKGYTLQGGGVNNSKAYYKVSKKVQQEINL